MTSDLGRRGEDFVASWLSQAGWTIRERNWRTRRGEIDLIASSPEGSLVFIEIKTWPHGSIDDLERVIDFAKRKRMIETAKCFLATHRQYSGMYIRFDVILVQSVPEAAQPRVYHITDAFAECE